jgi:hypothetical protein
VSPDNEQGDLSYFSGVRFGTFAAVLVPVLLVLAYLIDAGLYHPTREDELWVLHSRAALRQDIQPLDDSTVLSLHRTAAECFGCPDYTVRVFGSGKVEYVGDEFVCEFGERAGIANAREVRRLVEAMIVTGYFGFVWKRGFWELDAPSATSYLQHAGQSYRLYHYLGDTGAPRWLGAMEKEIDRVSGAARWLPDPSTLQCHDPTGGTRPVTMRERVL